MRVLVTGGAGYVGSVSVERLVAAGHEVTVLDSLVTGHRGAVPPGVELVVGSVGDPSVVGPLLARRRIEAVLHCAARSLVGESVREPDLDERENVAGRSARRWATASGGSSSARQRQCTGRRRNTDHRKRPCGPSTPTARRSGVRGP
jgi:UDP-glucose 4-epimerase